MRKREWHDDSRHPRGELVLGRKSALRSEYEKRGRSGRKDILLHLRNHTCS